MMRLNVRVREQGKIRGQTQTPVQERMVIENARFGAAVRVGAAVAAGVRQLQTDQQAVVGAGGQAMLIDQYRAQAGQAFLACARPPPVDSGWRVLRGRQRPLLRPKSVCAPLRPKRCQRRIVCSLTGCRRGNPSQPSMGCTAIRLPILISPRTRGQRSGDSGSDCKSSVIAGNRPNPSERKCS